MVSLVLHRSPVPDEGGYIPRDLYVEAPPRDGCVVLELRAELRVGSDRPRSDTAFIQKGTVFA